MERRWGSMSWHALLLSHVPRFVFASDEVVTKNKQLLFDCIGRNKNRALSKGAGDLSVDYFAMEFWGDAYLLFIVRLRHGAISDFTDKRILFVRNFVGRWVSARLRHPEDNAGKFNFIGHLF